MQASDIFSQCDLIMLVTCYLLLLAVVKETTQTEQPVKQQEGEQDVTNKSAVNRLDELFKKTITAPQIYWLPLSSEEVSVGGVCGSLYSFEPLYYKPYPLIRNDVKKK